MKYKNKNYEQLVRVNEHMQVLTVLDADKSIPKSYPAGTLVSSYFNGDWYLFMMPDGIKAGNSLRNCRKIMFESDVNDERPLSSDVVLNGGFSDGFNSWIYSPPVTGHGGISIVDIGFGNMAAKFNCDDGYTTSIRQECMEVGKRYLLNIRIHSTGLGNTGVIMVGDNSGNNNIYGETSGSDIYTEITPVTDGFIRLATSGQVVDMTVDYVRIQKFL